MEYLLNEAGIDRVADELTEWMRKAKIQRKNILRCRLTLETVLMNLSEHYNKNITVTTRIGKHFNSKANMILASMEGIPYMEQTLQLEKGDMIFLYTDGVTEATNENNELYGEDRLLKCLSSISGEERKSCKKVCDIVKEDLDRFYGDAPQFDDITILLLKWEG